MISENIKKNFKIRSYCFSLFIPLSSKDKNIDTQVNKSILNI